MLGGLMLLRVPGVALISTCTSLFSLEYSILLKQKMSKKLFIILGMIACIAAAKRMHCDMGMMEA